MSESGGAGRRIALCVEYDGSRFHGWQVQGSPALPTVQGAVEAALSQVAAHPLRVNCAGRTDTGVHASAQILHFDSPSPRPEKAWLRGGNALLPPAVAVRWAREVSPDFHARFSARARRYRYLIINQAQRPALLRDQLTWHAAPLDVARMAEAGRHLLGELDFSAYRGAACQSSTPMREVTRLELQRFGDLVMIDIEANAFLLHMVRNIAGVLLTIGDGRRDPDWAREVLESRDRRQGAVTAPPQGLYLVQVSYPADFGLPREEPGPSFLRSLRAAD